MSSGSYDICVIGGGIVGLATADSLARTCRVSVIVLEAEPGIARHQTGHNSGVIHSGLYYRPGSLKAANCTAGREALYTLCAEAGIPHERCGKVVVATEVEQLPRLQELERRGIENGLVGIERLDRDRIREREPHAEGVGGLFVPQTGIVDYRVVSQRLAERFVEAGGEVRTGFRVRRIEPDGAGHRIASDSAAVRCGALINCAGLQSDRVARLAGLRPSVRIVPFRGEYHELRRDRRHLVSHLIYPVPDPAFPFLGVHFTRMIDGGVEVGPNAVLAFRREGYGRWDVSARDLLECGTWPGFWRLAARHGRMGLSEWRRSLSRRVLARDLARLVPEVTAGDLEPAGAGVRAQAVNRRGDLLDDFVIEEGGRMLHVLNAPSPAATASLSIGATLCERARAAFDLSRAPA